MSEENKVAEVKMKKKVEGVTQESLVTVLAESNPKREGSKAHERFEMYFGLEVGTTVKEAIDAGLTMGDIHYDFIHGNIDVEGANVVEYAPTPRGEKAEVESAEGDTAVDSEEATEEGF